MEANLWFRTQRLGESLKRETHHELFTESVNKIALSANAKTISNPLIGNFQKHQKKTNEKKRLNLLINNF